VDLEIADRELVASGHLGDFRKPEVGDQAFATSGYDEVRLAGHRPEAPTIEVIDVGMCDQHGIYGAARPRPPREQRIEQDSRAAQLGHRRRVA